MHLIKRYFSTIGIKGGVANNNIINDKFKLIEKSYDFILPAFLPIIIRLDGNSFKGLTKSLKLNKHDDRFHESMKQTSISLCNYFIGCKMIYSFSDEINILIYQPYPSKQFLSNRIQKLISIASSITSVNFSNNLSNQIKFNSDNNNNYNNNGQQQQQQQQLVNAYFDCRSFIIPNNQVGEYFYKRQKRCYSNYLSSISSDNNNNNNNNEEMVKKDIIKRENYIKNELNINLDSCPNHFKNGFIIIKDSNTGKWITMDPPDFRNNLFILNLLEGNNSGK